jgi:nitrogen fixation protein FixH
MTPEFRLEGRHVALALGLFFGVIFAVDALFVAFAITTHPGEDEKDAYVASIQFSKEIAQQRAQNALGWQAEISVVRPPGDGRQIEMSFRDRAGQPLIGLAIDAVLRHPTVSSLDRHLSFKAGASGQYVAAVERAGETRWELRATARSADGHAFELRHQL